MRHRPRRDGIFGARVWAGHSDEREIGLKVHVIDLPSSRVAEPKSAFHHARAPVLGGLEREGPALRADRLRLKKTIGAVRERAMR